MIHVECAICQRTLPCNELGTVEGELFQMKVAPDICPMCANMLIQAFFNVEYFLMYESPKPPRPPLIITQSPPLLPAPPAAAEDEPEQGQLFADNDPESPSNIVDRFLRDCGFEEPDE